MLVHRMDLCLSIYISLLAHLCSVKLSKLQYFKQAFIILQKFLTSDDAPADPDALCLALSSEQL